MKVAYKILWVITMLLIILVVIFSYYYKEDLYVFIRDKVLKEKNNLVLEKNEYYKEEDYLYVSNTDDFIVKDKEQILDIFYSIINS